MNINQTILSETASVIIQCRLNSLMVFDKKLDKGLILPQVASRIQENK